MNKIKNKDLYFIHIPKNAGTMFTIKYCETNDGHYKITKYDKKLWNKTVAIVRNPYDRVESFYKYAKMKKSYQHSDDGSTPYKLNELYNYCNKNTFEQYINDLCNNKLNKVIHLFPNYYWLLTPKKNIVSKILKFENLEKDINNLFNNNEKLEVINKSTEEKVEWTEDLRKKIYDRYKKDFELFGYKY